jgi:transposase-like protein
MTRRQMGSGGRKEPWSDEVRADAVARAERDGPERASDATGVPSGTIRSWLRRRALAEERATVSLDGLAQIQAEGRAIVERYERELAERGPRKLAPGEVLSGCSPVGCPEGAVPWTAGSQSAAEPEVEADG